VAAQRWVALDVGETLIDETRVWTTWAEVLGFTPLTLMAALGAAIVAGDHRGVAEILGRTDWRDYHQAFEQRYGGFREIDLYPDARETIAALKNGGYRVAILANQPTARTAELRALDINPDVMAMSGEIGADKPEPAFFARSLELMGDPDPTDVCYVGDRLDNDVRPSRAAGMRPAWLRRGPWAALADEHPDDGVFVVDSLTELVERIDEVW
jgi:HAD superfamily hydrolase (TIGR01549 family)